MEKKKLYFIVGPTASGKTKLSIALARMMNAEIISADSIQLYEGLDIGSAKPDVNEMDGVTHHMLSCVEPTNTEYSVACYRKDALSCIEEVLSRGKTAIVVGGTGLYVNSLIYPLDFPSAPPDAQLRAYWQRREQEDKGCAHRRLCELDPITAGRLHPNDTKRVIRALEILKNAENTTGAIPQDFQKRDDESLAYIPVIAGLSMPRDVLYDRINERVDIMLSAGLENETRALLASGVPRTSQAMQGLGYRQMCMYINGECDYNETVESIKRETRRYAKRQLTWFRREKRIRWFDLTEFSGQELVKAVYAYFMEGNNA